MKKIITFFALLLCLVCSLILFSCNNDDESTQPPVDPPIQEQELEISGVLFEDKIFEYDGTEKEILATNIPEGVIASYENNKYVDAGTYNATVTLTAPGYKTKILTANLIINTAEIKDIVFSNATYDYDGTEKELLASNIPNGITAVYTSNKGTDAGTYNATLTLSAKNYTTKVLNAVLLINKIEITDVSFSSLTYDYDGNEKELTVSDVPSGIQVSYQNNKGLDAGTYNATATLTGKNYITKELKATLLINKLSFKGISLQANQQVTETNDYILPTVTGIIPSFATVNWYFNNKLSNNGIKDVGEYSVKLIISAKNYNTLELTTSFKIKIDVSKIAQKIIESFGAMPDAWSFLPESFAKENKVINQSALPNYNSGFVNVNTIPTNYIGKQLNVVYGILIDCDTALSYVSTVTGSMNSIANLYQTYINNNPDNYSNFSGTVGSGENAFNFNITLNDTKYILTANIKTINVKLFADAADNTYGARIQLKSDTVLKYEVSNESLTIAINVLNSCQTLIKFERDSENTQLVTGYIYENLSIGGKDLVTTSALIKVDETYTTVVGTKGDFIPTADGRNCEVYNNATGELVGTEVSEVVVENKAPLNTLWYNLRDITGITSIKKLDNSNVLNPDTIYINGSSDTLHTTLRGGLSVYMATRQYDIEFKMVCAYTYDSVKDEYSKIEFEVPMMFIQEEYESKFSENFADENYLNGDKKYPINVNINKSTDDKKAVNFGYYTLVDAYNIISNNFSQQDIINYCAN